MNPYPKIWAIGTGAIQKIFDGPVFVEEKVDGSQFGFGLWNGELVVRSKGQVMPVEALEKMFAQAVAHVVNFNQVFPLMAGKFVSEAFKEVHRAGWKKEHTGKGRWETFVDGYRTEARWHKAIQHLREGGKLDGSPKDIGPLIKEIQKDVAEEERQTIMEFLWKEFGQEVLRKAIAGFPEWYKEQLLAGSFGHE